MRRREFITLIGGAAAWPIAAHSQQQPTMPVIGLLYGVSAAEWAHRVAAMRRGLGEMGFVEGRNAAIDYRWAAGQFDRLPEMAADLVNRNVAVITCGGSDLATRAAMAATQTIPIIFTTAGNPVQLGFVASLNRPGGNATGVTTFGRELGPKRLELLRELLPAAGKIALLVNPNQPAVSQAEIQSTQAAARRLGLEIIVVSAGTENEIESALATAVQQGAAALQVSSDAFLTSRYESIAATGLHHALPTISNDRSAVRAGQLMSYASNAEDLYRQAGTYIGRILKGEKPGDLPVLQPTKFELAINLKTATTLGLTIPEAFLLRADEVIE
jgi:putative tryptophan/tyrosine transport system substrate-binding protein